MPDAKQAEGSSSSRQPVLGRGLQLQIPEASEPHVRAQAPANPMAQMMGAAPAPQANSGAVAAICSVDKLVVVLMGLSAWLRNFVAHGFLRGFVYTARPCPAAPPVSCFWKGLLLSLCFLFSFVCFCILLLPLLVCFLLVVCIVLLLGL